MMRPPPASSRTLATARVELLGENLGGVSIERFGISTDRMLRRQSPCRRETVTMATSAAVVQGFRVPPEMQYPVGLSDAMREAEQELRFTSRRTWHW